MAVLYVKEQGSFVQKRGERIVVSKGNLTLLEIPVVNIENVAIIGNVQITTQALHIGFGGVKRKNSGNSKFYDALDGKIGIMPK